MAHIVDFFGHKWVVEKFNDTYLMGYRVVEELFDEKSPFQQVDVVQTAGHGKMLLNDHLVMTCERDEFAYHEMISHVPLMLIDGPKKVLIIGGGDGGTAREVLRHSSVEKCVMVEIDKVVVEACEKHLSVTSNQLKNPRLELHIDDGVKFVAETQEKFDLILVDSTDPIGPAAPLFGREFYSNVSNCLSDKGIVVSQGESGWYHPETQKKMLEILSELFPIRTLYNFSNLTYPGGLWSFTFASKSIHPINDFDKSKVQKSGLEFKYYNEEIHRSSFGLPQFMKENLQAVIKI